VLCVLTAAIRPAGAVPLAEPHGGEPVSAEPRWARGMPTDGTTSRRWLLLTFDDGPRPDTTRAVARTLLGERVPAVFFVNGVHMTGPTTYARKNREIVAWLAEAGFTIGNHGLRHAHLGPLYASETAREIVGNEELITEVTGQVPKLFRPPYGSLSLLARDVIEARGYTEVGWTFGAADFIEQSALSVAITLRSKLARNERRGVRGGIIVLHDAHPWTAEALPLFFDWVRRRNCELLADDEELYEFVDFDRFFVPRRGATPGSRFVPADEPSPARAIAWQRQVREDAARRCPAPDPAP
jgi:peptidoglycan/xylan/chitin deacetylase (PgdA/CDA1 family)